MAALRALLKSKCILHSQFNGKLASISNPACAGRLRHNKASEEPPSSEVTEVPSPRKSRTLADLLQTLNGRVPDKYLRSRKEGSIGITYVPWHIVNRIMNLHAPEWSGEVRGITYSSDGKTVSVVFRVTIFGVDGEIYRESTGSASVADTSFGDPVQKAESMAFRRACARFGLGLHLYHEELD